jgi:hypothetical protein
MQWDDLKRLRVFQGGKKIADSQWAQATIYPVPDGPQTWRLALTTSRDAKVHTYSPTTRTVWDVRSPAIKNGGETQDLLPLLQVGYNVSTRLDGRRHGGRQVVGISVTHVPGAVGAGRIAKPTVAVSFDDGKHWRKAVVTVRRNGSTVATFTAPKRGYVTIRVSAQDSSGNRVTQRVVRAYGLR